MSRAQFPRYPLIALATMSAGAAQSYKVVLVGDLEVGKTTLFNRFKLGEFVESGDERQTRQEAEHHKTWEYKGEQFSVSITASSWGIRPKLSFN